MTPFPLDTNYKITEDGRVYSDYIGKFLATRKTFTPGNEYEKFWCAKEKKEFLVHRAMGLTFNLLTIEEFRCRLILINHKDGIKRNNHLSNLEKITPSGNLLHYHQIKHTAEYLSRKYSLETLQEALKLKEII
jgi:hypothetical protein